MIFLIKIWNQVPLLPAPAKMNVLVNFQKKQNTSSPAWVPNKFGKLHSGNLSHSSESINPVEAS